MESPKATPSLGRRFVLLVLIGAVVPLGAIGLWVTQSAARSGRALLRSQLEVQLAEVARGVEQRWQQLRSDLMTLGENEPVRLALLDSSSRAQAVPPFVQRAFAQMSAFDRVSIRDHDGRERFHLQATEGLAPSPRESGPSGDPGMRGIRVRVPITDLISGDTTGAIDASVRVAALIPAATQMAATAGPLVAVFGLGGGSAVPTGADERLFEDERVKWGGQRWLTVRRSLEEPPVELAVAGPLDPYLDPFERAAARGAAALLAGSIAILVVIVLVTRRMTRQVERELAQREALAAVGEFASELAHEVRNPLTAIRLDLQRVEEVATDPDAIHGIVPRVLQQIDRLDRAVSGALRVSRGGSIEPRRLDVRNVLESARRTAESEFKRRGAQIVMSQNGGQPLHIDGDAGALEQLFLNLLINAAQSLSTKGEARVDARQGNGVVEVTITDNGIGMTPTQLKEVGQPFRSTRRDGTGLGLKIARRIVTSHHGEMEMTSTPGIGTTVRIRLPVGGAALS